MTDEELGRQLDDADRALRASVAPTVALGAAPRAGPDPGRLTVPGRRSDDGRRCDLGAVHEPDGSWTFHGPGEPGVRVDRGIAAALAEAILGRARPVGWPGEGGDS